MRATRAVYRRSGARHAAATGTAWLALWHSIVPARAQDALTASSPTSPNGSPGFADRFWDLAATLLGGPQQAMVAVLLLGVSVVGLAAVALAVASTRARLSERRRLKGRITDLEGDVARLQGVLATEPHILFVWPGKGETPRISGRLAGLPEEVEKLVSFEDWLEQGSAAVLGGLLQGLHSTGTPFSSFVTTGDGMRLVADGFAAAGSAALKVHALSGASLAAINAADDQLAIRRDAESLKAGLASSPVLVWLRDAVGRLTWVNRTYQASVGVTDGSTDEPVDLVPEEKRSGIAKIIGRGAVARESIHAVVDGARHTFEIVETPTEIGSAGVAVDVTELDRLRDELDRHITAHARTLDQIATGVAIFGPDEKLNFFNAAYVELWKLDEAWLRQHPSDSEILDTLRDHSRLPEQADYRGWKKRRLDVYKEVTAVEDWWHLPDGQSLRVVVEPHPFGGVTHLYENVTEKLALESRYNALFSVQRETLDNLHEGAALFGSDGRLKLSNPSFASIWQLGQKDLENQPHMDTVIGVCRELTGEHEHWDVLRTSVSAVGGERQPVSGRINRPDNVVVDYASVPLPDGATLFTYVDVTDSWRIEQALRERTEALLAADRLKSAFISHVSYELRAPLTSIKGFADLLDTRTFGDLNEKQAEYVGYIQSSSEKLHRLIDDILDLATIDAGVMQLDLDTVDIEEVLRAAGGLLNERLHDAGLKIAFDIPADIGGFRADGRRIKQVLYNLLSNAIGFSEQGTVVTVGVRRESDDVLIWVSDQGLGMTPEVRERVFDRFTTITDGTNHRGSGLGLSVVKSLVELHGGAVEIDSTEGLGTTVRCRFPLEARSRQVADDAAHEHAILLDSAGMPAATPQPGSADTDAEVELPPASAS